MKIVANTLGGRNCPYCKASIPMQERLILLRRETVICGKCGTKLRPSLSAMGINAIVLACFAFWFLASYTSIDFVLIPFLAIWFVHTVMPGFDLLFSLEKEEAS